MLQFSHSGCLVPLTLVMDSGAGPDLGQGHAMQEEKIFSHNHWEQSEVSILAKRADRHFPKQTFLLRSNKSDKESLLC